MAFTIIVTDAGRAALINADNTGTAPVTIAEVGVSATAIVPDAAAVALADEYKRIATISGDVVADDTIHLIVRDESNDVFTVRSLGLYLADGTLFAIYGQADPILEKSAQALVLLQIDIQFADVDAATLTFGDANFLNPPATTETPGVVELSTVAEAQAGMDALRPLTPATAKAAVLGWLLTQDGSGSGVDADTVDGQHASAFATAGHTHTQLSPQNIGDAQDLNTYLTPGIYYQNSTTYGLNGSNYPGPVIGLLEVFSATGNRTYQRFLSYGSGETYVRAAGISGDFSAWRKAWDTLNDGSGSGSDSDLLDGQHGAWYADIAARLGFTPVNKAGDTMGGLLTLSGAPTANLHAATKLYVDGLVTASALLAKLLTVDGSGSGYDADMLDGLHGSSYVQISGTQTITGQKTLQNPILTTPSINSAQVPTIAGAAPLYMARASVVFNGEGAVSILEARNVSSVSDNGTGLFTVNFSTPMANANYAVAGMACQPTSQEAIIALYGSADKLTTSCKHVTAGGGGSNLDFPINSIVYF